MIRVDGLTRRFGDVVAVHPFAFALGRGGITGLLGPNGAGKSTLMRMMLGLVPRDGGTCVVDGVPLAGDGRAVRERATYSPGEIAVYGELTARQHVAWLLRRRDRGALGRALAMLAEMEIPLEKRVRGFSHGMKRALFLAAALAPEVPVRILDEPSEGLDPSRRGEVLELLRRDAESGTTILLSSHHLGEVDRACDRTLFLADGRLLDEQHAGALRARFRRALRITWDEPIDEAGTRAALAGIGETRVFANGALVFLEQEDPRPALEVLARASTLPRPTSIGFGELSLGELYRELYGREGV